MATKTRKIAIAESDVMLLSICVGLCRVV